jgi:tetratricopeptide (TPR) repeat protein
MPSVTCTRCFAVFDSEDSRPGAAPLCPACAADARYAQPDLTPPEAGPGAYRFALPGRRLLVAAGVVALAAALGGAAFAARRWLATSLSDPAPAPAAAEQAVAAWRAAGLLPPAAPLVERTAVAAARVAAGRSALAADLPGRTAEAVQLFREAFAAAPESEEAAAGYATAFVEAGVEEAEGEDLRLAHELVRAALERRPAHPELLAAYARLLLAVPSSSNAAEARTSARRALAAAPEDTGVRLAAGLARLDDDPAAAARDLAAAAADAPQDRRLLTAAARARWAAGDAAGALALARARIALDGAHPGALALVAEIETSADRLDAARAGLARWAAAEPGASEPLLLQARLAYQVDGDLPAARRLLSGALARSPGAFQAARILAHRAAVERAAGDGAAARAAVAQALARVPASAPARFQAALAAIDDGDVPALRESAGVLGARGGPVVERLLLARIAERSGVLDEVEQRYAALAEVAAREPARLLEAAGALARLRLSGPALRMARQALLRDPLESRLRRAPTDFWEGPRPLAEAAGALEAIARGEPRAAGTALAAAAECELLLGHTRAAEELARGAQAAAPQASAPLALRAQIALDRGEARRAVPLARAGAEAGDGMALAVLARAHEALGRRQEAERVNRAALAARPDLVTARLQLARLLLERGAVDEGRAALVALLREEPSLGSARRALLELEEGTASRRP